MRNTLLFLLTCLFSVSLMAESKTLKLEKHKNAGVVELEREKTNGSFHRAVIPAEDIKRQLLSGENPHPKVDKFELNTPKNVEELRDEAYRAKALQAKSLALAAQKDWQERQANGEPSAKQEKVNPTGNPFWWFCVGAAVVLGYRWAQEYLQSKSNDSDN